MSKGPSEYEKKKKLQGNNRKGEGPTLVSFLSFLAMVSSFVVTFQQKMTICWTQLKPLQSPAAGFFFYFESVCHQGKYVKLF